MDTAPVSLLEGYPRKDGYVSINAGLNTFNFSFTLPQGIPSSIEGLYGKTKYKIILEAERANKFDMILKFPFPVICVTDLNLNLANSMSIKEVVSKRFSTFFIDKGSLELTIVLPMAGYILGQQLPIKCLVKNDSKIFISAVIFRLERLITYISNQSFRAGIKKEKQEIVELIGQHVEKESESQLKLEMDIPNIPPTSMNNNIIILQYFLKVRAIVTGVHCNLGIKIPVTIGTVPVYTQNCADPPATTAFKQQQLDNPTTASYPSCPNLSQLPPSQFPNLSQPQFPNSQLSPFWNPQFPTLQNSQLPPFRSMGDLPTPSAPPLYSDVEQSRDSGLPTYKQAQKMLANMVKYDPEHRAE